MNNYYDRWGCETIEKRVLFSEDGGYKIKISLTPKVWWRKILLRIGFVFFPIMIAEIYEEYRETTTIALERKKRKPNEYFGVFPATRGEKTLKLSVEPKSLINWDLDVHIERLFS